MENVSVVGQGNVAVDVARILLTPIDRLKVYYFHLLEQESHIYSQYGFLMENYFARRGLNVFFIPAFGPTKKVKFRFPRYNSPTMEETFHAPTRYSNSA